MCTSVVLYPREENVYCPALTEEGQREPAPGFSGPFCETTTDCDRYSYFNAVAVLYPFPIINHSFVSTVILGTESSLAIKLCLTATIIVVIIKKGNTMNSFSLFQGETTKIMGERHKKADLSCLVRY